MSYHGPPRRRPERLRTFLIGLVTLTATLGAAVVVPPKVFPAGIAVRLGLFGGTAEGPSTSPSEGSFAFLAHQPGRADVPVAYPSCRSIHVEIDPDGGPPGAVALVRGALAEVGRATGLRFKYDGTTTRRPRWSDPVTPLGIGLRDPVLVSFATRREVPALDGDVAGIGGSTSVGSDLGERHYVTGQVTLDVDTFRGLERAGRRDQERAIVLHELGHVVGLAHVRDDGELMNARNAGLLDFGPGDREGLALLGRGRCL